MTSDIISMKCKAFEGMQGGKLLKDESKERWRTVSLFSHEYGATSEWRGNTVGEASRAAVSPEPFWVQLSEPVSHPCH